MILSEATVMEMMKHFIDKLNAYQHQSCKVYTKICLIKSSVFLSETNVTILLRNCIMRQSEMNILNFHLTFET